MDALTAAGELARRIAEASDAAGQVPAGVSLGWAVVTSVAPLRIRREHDTAPLDLTPDAVTGCIVGDRVLCALVPGRRGASRAIVVLGVAGDGVWRSYTATLSGFSVGTAGDAGVVPTADTQWCRDGAMGRIRYRFVFGNNGVTSFAGGAVFSLPFTPTPADDYTLHRGSISRPSTSATHLSLVRVEGASARIALGSSPLVNLTSTTPWGGPYLNGDVMTGEVVCRL